MEKRRGAATGLILVVLVVTATPAAEITYRVTFDATWTAQTHPQDFPTNAHFSDPVGTVHNSDVVFWKEGDLATTGIETA